MTAKDGLRNDRGLRSQIQRAAVSVMSNLAEGYERTGSQETLHFYNIARASCGEVRSLLYVVEDNYPAFAAEALALREPCRQCGRMISGLIHSTRQRQAFITLAGLATLLLLSFFLLPLIHR